MRNVMAVLWRFLSCMCLCGALRRTLTCKALNLCFNQLPSHVNLANTTLRMQYQCPTADQQCITPFSEQPPQLAARPHLAAWENKWQEEYSSFQKLCRRLLNSSTSNIQGNRAHGCSCDCLWLSLISCQFGCAVAAEFWRDVSPGSATDTPPSVATCAAPSALGHSTHHNKLTSAVQEAEKLLQETHETASELLGDADIDKLTVKALRMQRNQAFEKAKAIVYEACCVDSTTGQ